MKKSISQIAVSVGIFAHNEEKNIAKAIKSVTSQKTKVARIESITIVSSGSSDRTNKIVQTLAKKNAHIHLITEAHRQGKAAAINLFLQKIKTPVALTMSGDLRLHKHAIEEMVIPFLDPSIGMVGGHPIPTNTQHSLIGPEMKLLWELHHQISLKKPKCGELVAFRNSIHQIPKDAAVDEAAIEVLLSLIGYLVVYAPKAVVYNKVPRNVKELLMQRRRVYTGHQWIHKKYNYTVSTLSFDLVLNVVVTYLIAHPHMLGTALRLAWYELIARVFGWIDFNIRKQNPYIWNMVKR